jgi:hypothetical protein
MASGSALTSVDVLNPEDVSRGDTMKYGKRFCGLVVALGLLLIGGQASAQAPAPTVIGAAVPDGDYHIVGNHAGEFSHVSLDVPNSDTRAGIFIQLYPYRSQANQLWRVRRQADGFYKITNVNSGLALDVPNGSLASGVAIQQFTPHNGDNQRWRFDFNPAISGPGLTRPAFYRIVNKRSGLRLDVPNGDYSAHQLVQQYTPNSGWNQTWILRQ